MRHDHATKIVMMIAASSICAGSLLLSIGRSDSRSSWPHAATGDALKTNDPQFVAAGNRHRT